MENEERKEELSETKGKGYKVISTTLPNEIDDMLERFCEIEKRNKSNAITVILDEKLTEYLKNTEQ